MLSLSISDVCKGEGAGQGPGAVVVEGVVDVRLTNGNNGIAVIGIVVEGGITAIAATFG